VCREKERGETQQRQRRRAEKTYAEAEQAEVAEKRCYAVAASSQQQQ